MADDITSMSIEIAEKAISESFDLAQSNSLDIKTVLGAVILKLSVETSKLIKHDHKQVYIYYIKSDNKVKIGISVNPNQRLSTISKMCPNGAVLLGWHKGDIEVEKYLHKKFKHLKHNGEWFKYSDEIKKHIEEALL